MSSKYFATVYDIVKPIATFLHPIRVEGLENVPKEGPVLLCPNHSSNWDPILLICALGREANLQIMGKNQLFKIPILRTFLRKMGVFPVDRGHSDIGAVKRSIQALKDGFMLMVFPEGTRVRKKNRGARPKGGHDGHPGRSQADAHLYRHEKAAVCQGAYYFRQALYTGIHRAKGNC